MSKRTIVFYLTIALSVNALFSLFLIIEAVPIDNNHNKKEISSFNGQQQSSKIISHSENGEKEIIRNKRTVGFLRQLFPGLSQIIDRKIQQITRVLFRVVGRLILRGGGAGGAGAGGGDGDDSSGSSSGGGNGNGGRKITITLPTFEPAPDDEEESNSELPTTENVQITSSETSVLNSTTMSDVDLNSVTETSDASPAVKKRKARDVADVLADSSTPAISIGNAFAGTIRDEFAANVEDLINGNDTTFVKNNRTGLLWRLGRELRDMRNKRNLRLSRDANGGGHNNNGALSGGGASRNILFDIIRLVAGGGKTPEKDEELNGPREERDENGSIGGNELHTLSSAGIGDEAAVDDDGYTAGIPGPLTSVWRKRVKG